MGARNKIARMVLVLLVLLVAGVLLSSGYQAFATGRDLEKYPAPGQLIDVGGYRLHIYCVGEGSPTIVMEAGMSGWSTDWLLVQPEVAEVTRACAYDRAGYGWSDEGPRPQDSQQVATALNRLLAEAGIEGEIILVGHSLGGVFAHYYAREYPEQVVGLVLVDSVHPRQSQIMPEDVRDKYEGNLERLTAFTRVFAPTGLLRLAGQTVSPIADKLPGEYQDMVRALGYQSKAYRALDAEMAAFRQSQAQVQEAGPLPEHILLATIRATVVENYPPGFSADTVKPIWDEMQADLSDSATLPPVVATHSGHYVHVDEPGLVAQTILDVVNRVREG